MKHKTDIDPNSSGSTPKRSRVKPSKSSGVPSDGPDEAAVSEAEDIPLGVFVDPKQSVSQALKAGSDFAGTLAKAFWQGVAITVRTTPLSQLVSFESEPDGDADQLLRQGAIEVFGAEVIDQYTQLSGNLLPVLPPTQPDVYSLTDSNNPSTSAPTDSESSAPLD